MHMEENIEVEIKSKVEDFERIEKILKSLNAVFLGELEERDIYFNHPMRDFKLTDEALRIRNGREFTYKGPKVDEDTKSRLEFTVKIENGENMRLILEKLGFKAVAEVRKKRRNYKIGDVIISLDSLPQLGNFVEIECFGPYTSSRKKVLELAEKLGLKNFERRSYLELLLEKSGSWND